MAFCRVASACAGVILVAVSSTPMPAWFYAIAGLVTLSWIAVEGSTKTTQRRVGLGLRYATLAFWWLGIALELPFHLMPRHAAVAESAGVPRGRLTQRGHWWRVRNLAQAACPAASRRRSRPVTLGRRRRDGTAAGGASERADFAGARGDRRQRRPPGDQAR